MINEALAERSAGGHELEARRSHLDLVEDDPVHQAAHELVAALIDSRWSLSAAVVVVALRRLCEAVTGTQSSAWPATLPFLDGITNCNAVKAASDGDDVPLASVIGAQHRPAASCD